MAIFIKIHCVILLLFRSSHQRCSLKIGALKNSQKFKGKHLCQSLSVSLGPANLFETNSDTHFPVNFTKFLRTFFFTEHLLVTVSEFLPYDEELLIRLLGGCYHYTVFLVPVNAYSKSKLLVEEQLSLKIKNSSIFSPPGNVQLKRVNPFS